MSTQITIQQSIQILYESGMSLTQSTTLIATYGNDEDVPLNAIDSGEYKYVQGL